MLRTGTPDTPTMDAAAVLQSRLLGAVLVRKGLLTDGQLEQAIALQRETGERLGEVVVEHFGVPRLELATILAELWESPTGEALARESLEQTLNARLEEIAASAPPVDERDEIRARLAALEAVRVADALALGARLSAIEEIVESRELPSSSAEATGCVAFLPIAGGYRVVELSGPLPEIGSSLELADGVFVVSGRGRSPLPLDERPCAYLSLVEPRH